MKQLCPHIVKTHPYGPNSLRFDHFGEEDSGVEMRAEVGLLSRNVLIRGEMESACYPPNPCDEVDYDTFGGHIIAKYAHCAFCNISANLQCSGKISPHFEWSMQNCGRWASWE